MEYPHPVLEQMRQVQCRMEDSFRHNRFDTFCHLAAERLKLLRRVASSSGDRVEFEPLQRETQQWIARLEKRLAKEKSARARWHTVTGRRFTRTAPSGRIVNQSG